jgi:hypothetical protein
MIPTRRIPGSPDALTVEWLTHVLRDAKVLECANVISFHLESFKNANGQLVRLTLCYDVDEAAPNTLIAKFPAADLATRSLWTQFRFYEREIRFYQNIANTSGLCTPRCYYCALDLDSGDSLLLLEDLSPAHIGGLNEPFSVEALTLAVREIAKLHARWWGNNQLGAMSWLPALDRAHYQQFQDYLQQRWPSILGKLNAVCSSQLLELGTALCQDLPSAVVRLGEPPQTIIHYDFHLGNILFAAQEGRLPVAVVDWELTSVGHGAHDVARLLGGSLPIERRRAEEQSILRRYHAALVDYGVAAYSFEQCFDDYRISMLDCLVRALIVVGMMEIRPAHTRKVLQYGAAVLDLHADEFVM